MSYKSTRTYEVKLLNRLLDFQSLVDNAVAALVEYSQDNNIDGGIGCNLELIYPDLDLINDLRGGWNHRVERLTEKIHNRFAQVDWSITRLRSNLYDVVDFTVDDFPHRIHTARRVNDYQFARSIELFIPCRSDFLSVLLAFRTLLQMAFPDGFQYADSAKLTTWAIGPPTYNQVAIHEEVAKKVPWDSWLRIENFGEAIEFYQTPGVAENIVEQCKGVYMNADKAEWGQHTVRRYTYKDGDKTPLEVNCAGDLLELVQENCFLAFYSSVENRDASVAKVCIDIDPRWLLRTLIGPEQVWQLVCALCDSIIRFTFELGWPSPGIKFSGSKGIHLFWRIEKGAVGDEQIELEPYRKAMFRLDEYIAKKKTTEIFIKPFGGLRTLIQALVLRSKHKYLDWEKISISQRTLDALGLKHPEELITVAGIDDRLQSKLAVDIISHRKGVFRTGMSPHYSSGLVSRNIRNAFGQIDTRFRIWSDMKKLASREEVLFEMGENPQSLDCNPGVLTRKHLFSLAEELTGDVFVIAKFSPADASCLTHILYDRYQDRYAKLVSQTSV